MNSPTPTVKPPTPLIDERRARAVRSKAFTTAEHLLDVVDAQVSKLQEITQADRSLSEMVAEEGAIKAVEKLLAQIPAMLEMAKEAANPLTKLVGILRSEAPIPGEPKAFATGPGIDPPQEPESLDEVADEWRQMRIHHPDSESRKKPKRRKSKAG